MYADVCVYKLTISAQPAVCPTARGSVASRFQHTCLFPLLSKAGLYKLLDQKEETTKMVATENFT